MKLHNSLLIIVLTVSIAFSTPSTQIWIPSTYIEPFGNIHFGVDQYISVRGKGFVLNNGITAGALPFKYAQMEIGVDWRDINANHVYPFFYNAKLGMPENSFSKYAPSIAAGVYDLGFQNGINNFNLIYSILAKNIWKLGQFSSGFYYGAGNRSLWVNNKGEVDRWGAIISWDRTMTEISKNLWLAVDFQSGGNAYGSFNFGGAWYFAPNASILLGYDIYNNPAFDKTITIQVDLDLSLFKWK
jgi:hypothetical protein